MSLALTIIGLLKKKTNGKFEVVARWYINDDKISDKTTYLPNPEGKFVLTVKTKKSNEYLKADGSIVSGPPTGTSDLPEIRPMNYLMYDPPTVDNSDENNPKKAKPIAPIDPNDDTAKTGVGIYHILTDSDKSKFPKKLQELTLKAINGRASKRLKESMKGMDKGQFADQFSRYLTDSYIRPRNLQAIFVKSYKELEQKTFTLEAPRSTADLPALFSFHFPKRKKLTEKKEISSHMESSWQMANTLSELFKDRDYLMAMEEVVEGAEDLKSQLSILAGQGVEVIDYWCNPWQSQPNRVEKDCGKKYSLAEALGLGVTIGEIEASKVQEWLDNGDSLLFNVSYLPPTKADLKNAAYDWEKFHDLDMALQVKQLDSPTNIITTDSTNSLKNALDMGTSCNIEKPKSSRFDYDVYMKRLIPDFDNELLEKIEYGENLERGTGDGRALVLTEKPPEKIFPKEVSDAGDIIKEEESSIITGVNVYGVWQSEATSAMKPYFDDPKKNPDLKTLRPWLITRKYSYNKELKTFFAPDNPNILANQADPPIFPAFQQVEMTVNLEKIVAVEQDNTVLNEEMPHRNDNKDQIIYSLDVREGFKIDYDENLPMTWDKFPLDAREKEWQPEMQRGKAGVTGSSPQAYRFWVTTVDVFGQESEPLPVENQESSLSTATNIFEFKYRSELQAPPSNDDKIKDYIRFEYKNGALETQWQSPFKPELGHFGKEERGKERHPKNEIKSNILYLRKRHRPAWTEVSDEKLDEYIEKMMAGLPDAFKNNQWLIGLTEVLKHNIDWEVFHAEEKLISTTSGHLWKHKLSLEEKDSGYDYMALMNFGVKDEERQFWVADDPKRALNITEQVKSPRLTRYKTFTTETISELPATSQISYTESLLVTDQRLPRLIKRLPLEPSFLFSKPVLGVQAIDRDLALSNILTTPNEVKEVNNADGDPIKSVVFRDDEEFMYTDVQDNMAAAALRRCDAAKDLDLTDARKILRNELSNLNKEVFAEHIGEDGKTYFAYDKEEVNEFVAADLIGFRGLKHIRVRYNSILSNFDNGKGEAEAVKYEVYQTRIPLKQSSDFTYAFKANAFERTNVSKFSKVEFDTSIEPEKYELPLTLVVVCETGYQILPAKPVTAPQGGKYTVNVLPALIDTSNGSKAKEMLFMHGQLILEKPIELQDQLFYEDDVAIPVGGGIKELFIWAITTTSAIGKQSKNALIFSEEYQSSILPPSPSDLEAWTISTPDEKEKYTLEHGKHEQWLPGELVMSQANLKRQPRNFLKWSKQKDLPGDVYLAIEREFREEETLRHMLKEKIDNAWELLSDIEKGRLVQTYDNPEGLIKMEWLENTGDISLYEWLNLTQPIEKPGEDTGISTEELKFVGPGGMLFDPENQLTMVDGLIPDALSKGHVMFVDYFYDNEDLHFGMDTFRSYNYRVTSYIDMDPDDRLGLPNKYLYSKPGKWSGWVRPAFPSIDKIEIESESYPPLKDQLTPEVEFSFMLSRSKMMELREKTKKNLFYRVIVKREIYNSISTHHDRPTGSEFLEVGEVRTIPLNPKPGEKFLIQDDRLERENLKDKLLLNYSIEVSVIARDNDDQMIMIREPKIVTFKNLEVKPASQTEFKKVVGVMIS